MANFSNPCRIKDSLTIFLAFDGGLHKALILNQLIDSSNLVDHRSLTQFDRLLTALLGLDQEALRKVARVGANVGLGKRGVDIGGLLAVK